ncbi:MAG: methyltransferase [Granulosicoccaceae bacterium]
MLNNKLYSLALVTAQLVLIMWICTRALPAKSDAVMIPAILLIAAAGILAIAAIVTLRLRNLSVMPEPVRQGELITSGPYQYIRHPMYTSVLVACLGMLLLNFNLLSGTLLAALLAVLVLKVQREEMLLKAVYSGYDEYRKYTGALLPKFYKKQ